MGLKSEIAEQPQVLARLVRDGSAAVRAVAERIRAHDIEWVFVVARGSSDNAGLYAKYLWGAYNRLPVALAAPSLFTIYDAPPKLSARTLVVGISQSGQSPDIVSVLRGGRQQGALTVAITNQPSSPLAQAAELVLDTAAGSESAVAATKTYTAQLMCIAMIAGALTGESAFWANLERVPELVQEVLKLDDEVGRIAERYRYMNQCVVLGRGYNYASAYEWALKLKELAYVVALPYSSADFQHGPVALVSQGFPLLAVAPKGAVSADMLSLLDRLVRERGVEVVAVSNDEPVLALARCPIRLPADLPECLSPLVGIVPAQLFCYHLTRAKGFDTEAPRGLNKVTRTH